MNGTPAPKGVTRRIVAPQLIIGLLFLIGGTVVLLDNFGLMRAYVVLRLWPAGLILIGLSIIAQAQRTAGRVSGLFWIVVGTWLLLGNLGVLRLEIWDLWPIPIVMVGGYLIWQAVHGPDKPESLQDDSVFSALAVMAGVGRKINSKQFRGGEATALLGGVKIDLTEAALGPHDAVIDVFAFWGGIEMSVPEGWTIVNRVVAVLGGADDRTRPTADAAQSRLVLRGICVMGGIEIKNG